MKYLIHPESDSAFTCECKGDVPECCLQDGCVSEVDYATYRKFLLDSSEPSLTTPPSACYISRTENGKPIRRAFTVSKIVLTISADSAEELTSLIAGLHSQPVGTVADVQSAPTTAAEAPRRGRPRKAAEAPEAPTAPVETVSTPAAVETPAPAAVVEAPAPTPAPAVTTEAPAAVSKKDVQDLLIAAMKQFGGDGRAIVGAICRAHGGPNLSALAESTYPALYRDAKALLEMSADQAKATYLAVAA
jgi:hypothetical protein